MGAQERKNSVCRNISNYNYKLCTPAIFISVNIGIGVNGVEYIKECVKLFSIMSFDADGVQFKDCCSQNI